MSSSDYHDHPHDRHMCMNNIYEPYARTVTIIIVIYHRHIIITRIIISVSIIIIIIIRISNIIIYIDV